MKAIIATKYGSPDVLQYAEIEKPAPKDDEVLIKVQAASVNAYDWHLLTADIFLVRLAAGFAKPKNAIPGADMAGRVEAVGSSVTQFKAGDEVFGDIGTGSYAEFTCAKERMLAIKPANCSYDEAAATPMAALTALQSLRDYGRIEPGQAVLINGASGGVGSFALQFAKYFGAEVTAVCSKRNLEMARALGAEHVIDYAEENFIENQQRYDIILAANGYHSIFEYKRALKPKGIYVMAGGAFAQMAQALILGTLASTGGDKKMGAMTAKISQKDLTFIKELLETGKIKAVIDRRYPLSQTAEALRYLGEGHARGKIVITIPD